MGVALRVKEAPLVGAVAVVFVRKILVEVFIQISNRLIDLLLEKLVLLQSPCAALVQLFAHILNLKVILRHGLSGLAVGISIDVRHVVFVDLLFIPNVQTALLALY